MNSDGLPLDRLLVLSDEHNNKSFDHKDFIKIQHLILRVNLKDLINLSLNNAKLDDLCKISILDSHWDEVWRQCGIKLDDQLSVYENKPQSTIHSFDLIKGVYAYSEFLKLSKKNVNDERVNFYLSKAIELNYYPTLNFLIKILISKDDICFVDSAIEMAHKAAINHWAPGYLLLGLTYLQLAKFNRDYYLLGIEALITAKKLEPYSASIINNAFKGKSLLAATKGRIKTWDDIPFIFLSQLVIRFSSEEIDMLYKNANETVSFLLSSHEGKTPRFPTH